MRIVFSLIMAFIFVGSGLSQDLLLPEGFPEYEVIRTEDTSPGYVFLSIQPRPENVSWLVILDSYGTPVYYRYFPDVNTNLQLQPSGYLNFSMKVPKASTTAIMDSTFRIIKRVPIQNGYINDRHDFLQSEDGENILIGKDPTIMDLSNVVEGGSTAATVAGAVIQIQNSNREVIFEWNSKDHFNITDTYLDLTTPTIDNVHPNSIELDLDGNILMVSRAMNEVTKIDRGTGDIIWRLGGKNNQFTFSNEEDIFSSPHDIRVLKNGNYTLFDNGNERVPQYSRAIEYKLNTVNMTATKVWEYSGESLIYNPVKGSAQRLENGNTIMGYGALDNPGVIEVTPDGKVAWQLNYAKGGTSPRAEKHPWKTSLFKSATDTVDFGQWDGYNYSKYDLKIKNNSDKELQLSGYHLNTSAFMVENRQFPLILAPNEERSIKLFFYPDEIEATEINDVLTINSDISSDTLIQRIAIQVHLTGTKSYTSVESGLLSSVNLYPNPANDLITLDSPNYIEGVVRIFSLNGSTVYINNIAGFKTTIDVKNLVKGIYFIEIFDKSSNDYCKRKIVKI